MKYENLGFEYALKDAPQLTKAEAQRAEEILLEVSKRIQDANLFLILDGKFNSNICEIGF